MRTFWRALTIAASTLLAGLAGNRLARWLNVNPYANGEDALFMLTLLGALAGFGLAYYALARSFRKVR